MNIASFDSASSLVGDFNAFAASHYSGDPFFRGSDLLPEGSSAWLFLVLDNGKIAGRAAAMINQAVHFKDAPTGLVGWYECENNASAARVLLDAVKEYLRRNSCVWIVGPMNGSTWYKYRVTIPSGNPPFFLDNYDKPWYFDQFQENGFHSVAQYRSTKLRLTSQVDERIGRFETLLNERGIVIRQIIMERFEEEIEKIHRVCTASFVDNFLYSPIELPQFKELYLKVKEYIDPALILIAEDGNGDPVGFIFTVPNLFEKPIVSAVIKTVAIIPRRDVQGLGTCLVARMHRNLFAAGYTAVFHTLMHETNISAKILCDNNEPYHRYVLFGARL
jgi:hypothetical protein